MTPREILQGFFNEEWRTTTILSIVGIVVIIGGTKIFDWPGTVGGTLGCVLVSVGAWIHANKSIDIREREPHSPAT